MMIIRFVVFSIVLFTLSACGGAGEIRKQFGIAREAPDEFVVLKRAPLDVPPPYELELPEPRRGAQRPQEFAPDVTAKASLFGEDAKRESLESTTTAADSRFLEMTGTGQTDPDIRAKVNAETAALHDRNKPVAERLLNIGGDALVPSATVVDAEAEAARLRKNKEQGLAVTEGETPSIEE